jgi:nucleoside-diphosphate-sugar epimerase
MRIFMTGATGYIGGAVAAALRTRGHDVTALVRPQSDAKQLRDLGVAMVSGDLSTLPSLSDTLGGHDVLLHTAQSHGEDSVTLDSAAVDTFLGRRNAQVVYTSGVWVLGNTTHADERTAVNPLQIVAWRPAREQQVLDAGGAVIRPGCVYGARQSLCADWFAAAEQQRAIHLVGDGANRWAMVDLHDLADCYVLAIEQHARGLFHAVDDSHDSTESCARAVAPRSAIEKRPLETAREKLGPFADALAVDQVISSDLTRKQLGWSPRRTFVGSVNEQWREWTESQRA